MDRLDNHTPHAFRLSHLERFVQCPLSYRLHCADHLPTDIAQEQQFAAVLHRTLEESVRDQLRERQGGPLDLDYALESYRQAWQDSKLCDPALFAEGRELVQLWIEREGPVACTRVLGVETEFSLRLGDFFVWGTMDRVDRIGDDAILIRHYTATRRPPRREDVEASLKLAVYDLAARQRWPWVKRVEIAFDLLRHGIVLRTERTDAQREATQDFLLATVAQIRSGVGSARPSTRCTACDHRRHCPTYAELNAGKREHTGAAPHDLPAVAREREELATVLKALGLRKGTLDDILRAELEQQSELVLDGHRYTLEVAHYREYPFEPTIEQLVAAGVSREEALARLATIDGNALRRLLQRLRRELSPQKAAAIEDRLEAMACVSPVTRLTVREVRS